MEDQKEKFVKILAYKLKVVAQSGFMENKHKNNYEKGQGRIDYLNQEIRIDKDHPEILQTMIHELTHAADRFWYADLSEEQVSRISEGLYAILVENGVDLSPLLE